MTYSVNIAQTHSFPRPRPQFPMPEINRQCILERISIEGFRSFRSLQDFELRNINLLIGANGSGKSNFIDFVEWIGDIARLGLNEQEKSSSKNGIWDHDDILFFTGEEPAQQIVFRLTTAGINYSMTMRKGQSKDVDFSLDNKTFKYSIGAVKENSDGINNINVSITKDANPADTNEAIAFLHLLADLKVYHFHNIRDTLTSHPTDAGLPENKLARDGSNIAQFLRHLKLKHPFHYERIVHRISMDSPFLEDFILEPIDGDNTNNIQLRWKQVNVDHVFQPCQLSDGTLRLTCLAAVLLQPEPPTAIIIDELDLGLYPDAAHLLAETIRDAADNTQVIVSTHSPTLVDRFEPEDLVVFDRWGGATQLTRFTTEYLSVWLENYTLAELWRKNYLEGGAGYESPYRPSTGEIGADRLDAESR